MDSKMDTLLRTDMVKDEASNNQLKVMLGMIEGENALLSITQEQALGSTVIPVQDYMHFA
jgi:cellobiose-specific phosphotransferase system component IIA